MFKMFTLFTLFDILISKGGFFMSNAKEDVLSVRISAEAFEKFQELKTKESIKAGYELTNAQVLRKILDDTMAKLNLNDSSK